MKHQGERTFDAPRQEVWDALHDPDVLLRTLPGCSRFERTGDATYAGTLALGAAGARGSYLGTVQVSELRPAVHYLLTVRAASDPGTVAATCAVDLEEADGRTLLRHDAELTLGGAAAAAGAQLLATAADRTVASFLDAVEAHLAGADEAPAPVPAAATPAPVARPAPELPEVHGGAGRRRGALVALGAAAVAVLGGLLQRRANAGRDT